MAHHHLYAIFVDASTKEQIESANNDNNDRDDEDIAIRNRALAKGCQGMNYHVARTSVDFNVIIHKKVESISPVLTRISKTKAAHKKGE
jgi:hypothetical protein